MSTVDIKACLESALKTAKEILPEDAAADFEAGIKHLRKRIDDAGTIEEARAIAQIIMREQEQKAFDSIRVEQAFFDQLEGDIAILEALPVEQQLDAIADTLEQRAVFGKRTDEDGIRGEITGREKIGIKPLDGKRSIANSIAGVTRGIFARLDADFAKLRINPFKFQQAENSVALNVRREMVGINTGDAEAVAIKEAFQREYKPLLDKIRASGLPIGEIDNFFPRSFDLHRIGKDTEAFLSFMERSLDPAHHANPRLAAELALEKIKKSADTPFFDAKAVLRREFKYLTPELEVQAHADFGVGTVSEALEANMRQLVKMAVMTDAFGPQPFKGAQAVLNKALENTRLAAKPADEARINKKKAAIEARLAELSGDASRPESPSIALWGRTLRSFTQMSTLGKAALWNFFVDPVIAGKNIAGIVTGHNGPSGTARGIFEQVSNTLSLITKQNAQELLDSYGVVQPLVAGTVLDRFAPINVTGDALLTGGSGLATYMDRTMQAGNRGLMRFSGMASTTEALQRGTSLAFVQEMSKLAGRSLKEVAERNPELHIRLRESGITSDIWTQFARQEHMTDGLLDLRKLTDDVDIFGVTSAISGFMTREVRKSVTESDLMTRRFSRLGLRTGTIAGELGMSTMQFHSFSISFWRNAMPQALQQGGLLGTAASFAGPLMFGAALKVQLEEKLRNDSVLPWTSSELWMRSFDGSGMGYISAHVAMAGHRSIAQGRDFSLFDVIGDEAGPLIGRAAEATKLAFRGVADVNKLGFVSDKTLAAGTAFGLSLIPYQNALPIYLGFSVAAGKTWTNMAADSIDPMREIRRKMAATERRLP